MEKEKHHQTVERLFQAALTLAPEERASFLASSCGHDPDLLAEVQSLFSSDRNAEKFVSSLHQTAFLPSATQEPATLNRSFGHYQILELLGRGGMGEVYRARDTRLARDVAIKFVSPELARDETKLKRLEREARMQASLNHPNIATIYGLEYVDESTFLVMELVPGETLDQRLARAPLSSSEAIVIVRQIAEGLEAAHRQGIIHRDLKPANIKLMPDDRVKLLDFGLAKALRPVDGLGAEHLTSLTEAGLVVGTPAYMSPEQVRGEATDARTDLWALGVMLYEMVSGARPFQATTVGGLLSSILTGTPTPLPDTVPGEVKSVIERCLEKDPVHRYPNASHVSTALKSFNDVDVSKPAAQEQSSFDVRKTLLWLRQPLVAVSVAVVAALIVLGSLWFFNRQAKIRWARQVALAEIERLIETNWSDFTDAYKLAKQAEKYIPNDPQLAALFSKCSLNININTQPEGASVYVKEYKTPEGDWEYLGVTPIERIRLPVGIFRWKIEKEGYEPVLAAASSWELDIVGKPPLVPNNLVRVLDQQGSIPEGMVRVPGRQTPLGKLDDFFIDKYEVTNKQYRDFLVAGGYKNREYWKQEFRRDGRVLTWDEAMAAFVDQTGRPGPSTWQAGDYREGQGDYPVSGISWYEAEAYAAFVGKSLPTAQHWGLARGEFTSLIKWPQLGGYAVFAPFSNFGYKGPAPVGSFAGITSYGAYDMAGNVREWCWNETPAGRLIRGGAWHDNTYRFTELGGAPSFDRSPQNGFRCALYREPGNIPPSALAIATSAGARDFYKERPVSEEVFQVYREQFSYDRIDLDARLESKDESSDDWNHERITFAAAYGNERVIAHLFLPKNTQPPYQTVIYVPGSGSLFQTSSEDLERYYEFPTFLSFLLKNGRAVLYPIYKGTFERRGEGGGLVPIELRHETHSYTNFLIQVVKDFKRSIDYLETRQDIDSKRLAYFGMSWGGALAAIIPAVETRFRTTVILGGGLRGIGRPEANQINYITRVKMPTLMLHGKYDTISPYETSIKPMFDLLGTPDEHKKLKLYDTDHIAPKNEFIKEILSWLDLQLGPVK